MTPTINKLCSPEPRIHNSRILRVKKNVCGIVSVAAIARTYLGTYGTLSADNLITDYVKKIGNPDPVHPDDPSGETAYQLATFVNLEFTHGELTAVSGIVSSPDSGWIPETNFQGPGPYLKSPKGERKLHQLVSDWLIGLNYPIALVRVHNSNRIVGTGGGPNHWVTITGLSSAWDFDDPYSNRNWVAVYNSIDNETEYYPWKVFEDSWAIGGYNTALVSVKNRTYMPPRTCPPDR